jgi:hypothetical protein
MAQFLPVKSIWSGRQAELCACCHFVGYESFRRNRSDSKDTRRGRRKITQDVRRSAKIVIRKRHGWREILLFHRGVIRTGRTRAGHAGISSKPARIRNYGGQFGGATISKCVSAQGFVRYCAGLVTTPICRCRAIGARAIPGGAKRRTARRNDESHERHHAQNSQRPARAPNSPRS